MFIYIGIKSVQRFRIGLSQANYLYQEGSFPKSKLQICLKLIMVHQPFITHVISLGENRCHFNVLDINRLHSQVIITHTHSSAFPTQV